MGSLSRAKESAADCKGNGAQAAHANMVYPQGLRQNKIGRIPLTPTYAPGRFRENVTKTKFLQVAGNASPLCAPSGLNGGANLHGIGSNGHVRHGRGFLGERFLPGRLAVHVSSLCLCHGSCSAAKLEHPEWR